MTKSVVRRNDKGLIYTYIDSLVKVSLVVSRFRDTVFTRTIRIYILSLHTNICIYICI